MIEWPTNLSNEQYDLTLYFIDGGNIMAASTGTASTNSFGMLTSLMQKGGNAALSAAETIGSAADTEGYLTAMKAMQTEANHAALVSAALTNQKAMNDALAKIIKSNGESVKAVAPQ